MENPISISDLSSTPKHIKILQAYTKNGDTRYVVVLSDNSIWWYMPNHAWQSSSLEGLPAHLDIVQLAAYTKADHSTRYVVVLSDNSIWWYMPDHAWQPSSVEGLPPNYVIKQFDVYLKNGDTRYVVVLSDNSIWWYMPNRVWEQSSMEGLEL